MTYQDMGYHEVVHSCLYTQQN